METKEVIHKQGQMVKVLLQKTREGYNWEIHIQGEDIAEILPELRSANSSLEKRIWGKIMPSSLIELNENLDLVTRLYADGLAFSKYWANVKQSHVFKRENEVLCTA